MEFSMLRPLLPRLMLSALAQADEPLRIERLQRCEDLLSERQVFCAGTRGLAAGEVKVLLGGKALPASALRRDGDRLRLDLGRPTQRAAVDRTGRPA